jgi:PAS domain S-box-containing protein
MKSVLVVDNEPLILRFMKELIEEKSHRALLAASGLEALELLESVTPDIVFVDLVMPNIDGRRLCRFIRRNERFSRTKVVILSAIASEDSHEIKELGAHLCMAKGPLPQMKRYVEAVLDDKIPWDSPPQHILGAEPLTSRKIVEELISTRKHLELILNHVSEGIMEVNPEGRIVFSNPAACKLIGNCELELLGKKAWEVMEGKDAARLRELVQRGLSRREALLEEGILEMGSRKLKPSIVPLPGDPAGAIIILSDVTTLQRTNDLLSAILDGAPFAAWMVDGSHNVVLWNRAMEELTGVTREEVMGRATDPTIFYPEAPRPMLVDLVLDMDVEGIRRWYSQEDVSPHPSFPEAFEGKGDFLLGKKRRSLRFVAARVRDPEGNLMGAIETLEDITEKEELEKQLQHAQKMQAVGTLAAGVAHEFNNILAAIQGYAQLMGFGMDEKDPNREYLREIEGSCQRAAGLIKKMLSFSRIERAEKLPLKVNQVIEGVAQMLRQTLPPDITISLRLGQGLPFVLGEYSQLEQVILNLCLNSRDAMPEGGNIIISTSLKVIETPSATAGPWAKPGRFVEITIEDDGLGMEREILPRIFEPFFTTKEPGKGTGLGLTIVYSVVKSHNGYIWAESPGPSGRGSIFTVLLPALEEEIEEEPPFIDKDELPRGKGERILVVDDEPKLLEIAARMLSSFGYRVEVAGDGREALALYEKGLVVGDPFELVVLDIAMPSMGGEECSRKILELNPRAKILISTGQPEMETEPGFPWAKGVLRKPFELGVLLKMVRMTLDQSQV